MTAAYATQPGPSPQHRLGLACLALLACLLVACAAPPRPPGLLGSAQGSGATALARQLQALAEEPDDDALSRRVIFIGAALNGREDVFDNDLQLMDQTLRRQFGTAYRSVLLSNVRVFQGERRLPLATIDHLEDVFEVLAASRRPNDRYVIFLDSHGHPGLMEVEQAARYASPRLLEYAKVSDWAESLAPQPSLIVLSACFSGSAVPRLGQDHVIVMTAAAGHRTSFGCSTREQHTWFVRALVSALQAGETGQAADSLDAIWRRTLSQVSAEEQARKLVPSMPQIRVGDAVKEKFDASFPGF